MDRFHSHLPSGWVIALSALGFLPGVSAAPSLQFLARWALKNPRREPNPKGTRKAVNKRMVWSKHDFEREVRRQMVELESIRKRCPEDADVHRRIDLLEESHRNLLRKLGDAFNTSKWPRERPAQGPRPTGAKVDPQVLEKYLQTCDQAALRLRRLLGIETKSASLQTTPSRRAEETEPCVEKSKPCFNTKCATCGEILFASQPGREGIVFDGTGWHHKHCPSKGELSGPGLLN